MQQAINRATNQTTSGCPRHDAVTQRRLVPQLMFGWLAIAFLLLARPAAAQFEVALLDGPAEATATLIAEHNALQPGQPTTLAIAFDIEPGWHLYYKNSENVGTPPTVQWTLPQGYTISEPRWQTPLVFEFDGYKQFGYEDSLELIYTLTPPADLDPATAAPVTIKAQVEWLACKESCIPGDASLSLTLPIQAETPTKSDAAEQITKAIDRLPTPIDSLDGWSASAARTDAGYTLTLTAPTAEAAASLGELYYFSDIQYAVDPAADQPVTVEGDTVTIQLQRRAAEPYSEVPVVFDPPLKGLAGVLVAESGFSETSVSALAIDAAFSGPATPASDADAAGDDGLTVILFALGSAFIGGLILNLMPCVFPVLSIKILGFVQQAGDNKAVVRRHGYAFGIGVMLSFWALAGLLLGLRAAAEAANPGTGSEFGWGYQMQNAPFVLGMIILVFLIGLNLIGAFEVGVGLSAKAGQASQSTGTGYSKSLFTGVLATLIATPCTAPFMGAALGAAVAMPTAQAMLVFTALGLGMATPYVLLSCFPALLGYLPRPGLWMESFKQAMAFPMFATAGWLIWVYAGLVGDELLARLLIGLTLVALGAWVLGRWSVPSRTNQTRWIARGLALLFAVGGIAIVQLKASAVQRDIAIAQQARADGQYAVDWLDFSPQLVAELREENRPILIDFTARWCVTCQANKKSSLRTDAAEALYQQYDVALVSADYTRKDPVIGQVLEQYNRTGVPLYLVYPANGGEPQVLPEILTPAIVQTAIEQAAAATSPSAASR